MKWIVVILVLLNLVAYLLGLKVDPEMAQISSDGQYNIVNAEAMSVISPTREVDSESAGSAVETEALQEDEMVQLKVDRRGEVLRAVDESDAQKPGPAAGYSPVPENNKQAGNRPEPAELKAPEPAKTKPVDVARVEPAKPVEPLKPAPAVLACYRLGPFSNQNSLASIRRKLENEKIQYRVDEAGESHNIKAVRVYLAVEPSDAAIEAARSRLKGMKIEHYVIRQNGSPMVQLGYFSEPGRASAYSKKLQARGLEVKTETIYHEASIKSWLEVELASREAIDQLNLPGGMVKKKPGCP